MFGHDRFSNQQNLVQVPVQHSLALQSCNIMLKKKKPLDVSEVDWRLQRVGQYRRSRDEDNLAKLHLHSTPYVFTYNYTCRPIVDSPWSRRWCATTPVANIVHQGTGCYDLSLSWLWHGITAQFYIPESISVCLCIHKWLHCHCVMLRDQKHVWWDDHEIHDFWWCYIA